RLLGSVGEPINPEAWVWYWKVIGGGRCPVVDTWWQTETGHILITPLPALTVLKPGSATLPFPGIDAEVLDEKGDAAKAGYLVLRKPWPGMLRGIWGDPDRFVKQYWSKYDNIYFTGDGAKRDEDGYFWLLGRVDDVMFSAELPKTRSGKIMRRLLRDIAEGRALGDTTTLADPTVVAQLKSKYEEQEG